MKITIEADLHEFTDDRPPARFESIPTYEMHVVVSVDGVASLTSTAWSYKPMSELPVFGNELYDQVVSTAVKSAFFRKLRNE